jgi:hypothetical protein
MSATPLYDQFDPGGIQSEQLADRLADCIDEIDAHPAIALHVLGALICERLETFPPEMRVNLTRAVTDTLHERIRAGLA